MNVPKLLASHLVLAGCLLTGAVCAAAPHPSLVRPLREARPNGAQLLERFTSLTPNVSNFMSPLTPAGLQTAYGLSGLTLNNDGATPLDGTGQTVAVLDLSGYDFVDVSSFEQNNHQSYSLPTTVSVDGAGNSSYGNSKEVLADLDYVHALAPGATILDYAAPDSSVGILDALNRIASDNTASVVLICFGTDEKNLPGSFLKAESRAFQQMAAQHMTVVVAAGDLGAYDTGVSADAPTVLDPAAQPYILSVGGTTLNLNADGSYQSETTWNTDGTPQGGAGGGGISSHWGLPAWQRGLNAANPEVSSSRRNIPDVSLDADPAPGYDLGYTEGIPINGVSTEATYGGTSCAAPVWAAFFALVNQQRAANGLGSIGFVNPVLYQLAAGPSYATLFHDIADNSTNLLYHAVPGYDLATGLGSLTGAPLLAQLATAASVPVKAPGAALTDVPVTHVKDLGPELPMTGKTKSRQIAITGINDQLLLVGSENVGGYVHAIGYDKAPVDLGTLGGLNSYGFATTYGQLSYSGNLLDVVGGADTAAGVEDAFFWQRDAVNGVASNPEMVDLGTAGGVSSVAYGLDDSLITSSETLAAHPNIVGDAVQASGATHAVVWANDGTVIDLAGPGFTTLGGPNSHAVGIYDTSLYGAPVFGYADTANGQVHAFEDLPSDLSSGSPKNTMTDLGTLGGPNSHVYGVQAARIYYSPDGNVNTYVVGDADTAVGVTHAALFDDLGPGMGYVTDLGTLGGTNSHAFAIATDYYIVGTSDMPDGTQHAFIVNGLAATGSSAAAMIDLNTFLPANSGWVLTSATGIWTQSEIVTDASGQSTLVGEIVGQGLHNGQPRAFELDTQISLGIGRQSGGVGYGKGGG